MKKNTWKKLMSLALGAMMMLSLLTGCGSKTEDSAPADSTPAEETPAESAAAASLLEKVKTSGKLVVGTEAQYAPYEFKDLNANFAGCDMWLAQQIADHLGVELEVVDMSFDGIIPAVKSGQVDLGIAAFTITKERMESVDFVSYFTAGMGYAVAAGNPKNVDENDLCGLNVAVETGTVEEEAINKTAKQCKADGKKDITIQSSKQQTDATTAVVTGKADVFFADSPVVGYAIAQTDGQLEQLGKDFDEVTNAIAIKKGDSQTTEAVQKAMQKLMDDGTYTKILQHWGVESGALDKAEINPAVE